MTLKQRLERLEKAIADWTGCPACDVRPLVLTEDQAEADAAVRECTCGNRKVILLQMADSKGFTPTKV